MRYNVILCMSDQSQNRVSGLTLAQYEDLMQKINTPGGFLLVGKANTPGTLLLNGMAFQKSQLVRYSVEEYDETLVQTGK